MPMNSNLQTKYGVDLWNIHEHPNYATLHNEQLVWGITTSKSSRQLPHVASIRRDC